jgi:hypothetical protein
VDEFGSHLARALWLDYGRNDRDRWKRYRAEMTRREDDRKRRAELKRQHGLKHRDKLKHKALAHYSPEGIVKCARCGFADIRSLSLRPGGGGWNLYERLKKAGWPEGYQVLCMNCQFISGSRSANYPLEVEVFGHYVGPQGIRCVGCNSSDIRALSLDHVEGGGRKHVEKLGSKARASGFYRWLKQNNYPKEPLLQVLCMNCQFIKASENLEW